MKILRIIARLNVGGPSRHVLWLTNELRSEHFESMLIAGSVPPGEDDMAYLADKLGVSPRYIPEMSREISIRDITSFWKIFREMRLYHPDIVHTHTAKAGTLGRLAAFFYRWFTFRTLIGRPRRIMVVHTFHGHVFHSYYGRFKTRVFIFIERLLASLATDKIVVISPSQLDEIHNIFRVGKRDQFEIIPLGIDINGLRVSGDRRNDVRKRSGIGEDAFVVAFIGRLTEIKNLPMLLQVAAAMKADTNVPRDLNFVIAGDGHLRAILEQQTSELGVDDIVNFIGNVEHPGEIYAASDVVALTSLNEGTPLSLIEAMAAGCPVIATAVGGVPDLLGEKVESHNVFNIRERGISVDSADVRGFVAGLSYLLQNKVLRGDLASTAKQYIEDNYSKERLIRDIVSLYENLAARPDQ